MQKQVGFANSSGSKGKNLFFKSLENLLLLSFHIQLFIYIDAHKRSAAMLWHLWQTLKCIKMVTLHFFERSPKTRLDQKEGNEFTPLPSAEFYVPRFPTHLLAGEEYDSLSESNDCMRLRGEIISKTLSPNREFPAVLLLLQQRGSAVAHS